MTAERSRRHLDSVGELINVVRQRLALRLGRRVTLAELGRLIGEREGRKPWPQPTVSRWINEQQRPSPATLAAVAALGGISLSEPSVGPAGDLRRGKRASVLAVDGRVMLAESPTDGTLPELLVEIKQGRVERPHVLQLLRLLEEQSAAMALLLSFENPAPGAAEAAANAGSITIGTATYPRIQLRTIRELLDGVTIASPRRIGARSEHAVTPWLPPTPSTSGDSLGVTLRSLRRAAGLKQHELAERVGISASLVSLLETGEREPSMEVLRRLGRFFGPEGVSRFALALVDNGAETGTWNVVHGKDAHE